jgi:hypothetical protein
MRKQIYIALAASLLAACGENGLMNSTAAPSQLAAPQASADEKLSSRYVKGPNSCPDGELVSGITVNANAQTQAYITWNDVGSIHEYIVRITRYQTGELVLQHSVKRTFEKVSLSGSTYVVYIGYQNDCGGFGPFGNGVVFSLDSPDNTPPAPVIEDGGYDDPPPPPTGHVDDQTDNDAGGPQGGSPCQFNPTSDGHGNDHGGNDHNGDGHADCGRGNDNGHGNNDDDHQSHGGN